MRMPGLLLFWALHERLEKALHALFSDFRTSGEWFLTSLPTWTR